MPEKMSRKLPHDCGTGALRRAAGWPPWKPEKSKPPKSTGGAGAAGLLAGIGLGRGRVDLVGVEADLVVDLALLLVGEDVVGFGDFLELLFGLFVVGVHVGMILARELAEGLADLIRSGRLLDAERGRNSLCFGWWAWRRSGSCLTFIVTRNAI
jgi:hypothetical protein